MVRLTTEPTELCAEGTDYQQLTTILFGCPHFGRAVELNGTAKITNICPVAGSLREPHSNIRCSEKF